MKLKTLLLIAVAAIAAVLVLTRKDGAQLFGLGQNAPQWAKFFSNEEFFPSGAITLPGGHRQSLDLKQAHYPVSANLTV